MKIKNVFITLGLAAAMGFGAFVGLKAAKGEIKEAFAEQVVGNDKTLYVSSGVWGADNAVIRLWTWKSSDQNNTKQWISGTRVNGNTDNNLYSFTLPEGMDKFIVVRHKPNVEPSWDDGVKWNQTDDIEYNSSNNYVRISGWAQDDFEYTNGAIYGSGDKLYFTAIADTYNWFDASANTTLSFWNYDSILGSKVNGSSTVEFNVPKTIVADGFNIYRVNPNNAEDKWNQTVDFGVNSSNKANNAFTVRAWSQGEDRYAPMYAPGCRAYDDTYLSIAYAAHLINETYAICGSGEGGTSADHLSSLSAKWSDLETVYNALLSDSSKKAAFSSSSDEKVADARLRYSHIIARYTTLDKFINDVSAEYSSINIVSISEQVNNTAIIIVIASTISLVALGGFFFIKRKKESK